MHFIQKLRWPMLLCGVKYSNNLLLRKKFELWEPSYMLQLMYINLSYTLWLCLCAARPLRGDIAQLYTLSLLSLQNIVSSDGWSMKSAWRSISDFLNKRMRTYYKWVVLSFKFYFYLFGCYWVKVGFQLASRGCFWWTD